MDDELRACQFHKSHRSARMEFLRADADFSTKTKFKTIGKSRRGIHIHGG